MKCNTQHVVIIFCERLHTSCCISPANLKKPDDFERNCRFSESCCRTTIDSV